MIIPKSQSLSLAVLCAGKGWLAVDKPAGITVHNDPGRDICSRALAFVEEEAAVSELIDRDPGFGVHPVHRLDRETSGILLLAAAPETFRFFSKQFESHQVRKRYVAIVHGRLEAPPGSDRWGSWRWALAKSAGGRQRPEGAGPRQPGETRYRVLDHSAHYTMVEIELVTGRRHQIRRHAKLAGHPVAGDARYGPKRAAGYLSRHFAFARLALHALALTLRLPGEATPKTLETGSIPDQMRSLFDNDRRKEGPVKTP